MPKLWSLVAHASGAQLYGILASTASLALTARLLGPTGRGTFAASATWVGLFATVGSLSLGQVLIHRVAGRPRDEWMAPMMGTVAALLVALAVAGWVVAAATYAATGGSAFGDLPGTALTLAFLAYPFLLAAEPVRYLLIALDNLRVANWAHVAGATTAVTGVLVLVVLLRGGVPGALGAFVASAAVPVCVGAARLRRHAPSIAPSAAVARDLLTGSVQLHLSTIGTYFFSQASILILNHYRPPAETGYFQLAMQMFGVTLVITNAIGAVAFQLVSQLGPDDAWPEQRRLIGRALLIVAVMAAAAYALTPVGVRVVAGSEFLPAVPVFRGLLLGLVGATFSATMASQWVGRGLFWQAGTLTLVVGICSVAVSGLLVPRYGMYGALAGTLVAYGASVVGNGLMMLRVNRWAAARRGRAA